MAETEALKLRLHAIGAVCLATAIWSMHFVGMIAYDMDMVHSYNLPLTFLSMMIAAVVAYSFIAIVRFKEPRFLTYCIGSLLLGLAICIMHYSGMLAMEMDAKILYRPLMFLLSIGVALSAAAVAMWLVYRLRYAHSVYFLMFSAVVIGLGICGLHYSGMFATVFVPYAECRFTTEQTYHSLAAIVIVMSCLIYIGSYLSMRITLDDRRFDFKDSWSNFTPVLVFIVGISIVTFSVIMTEGALKKQAHSRFITLSQEIEDGIVDKYTLYEQALYGGLGLFEASNYVTFDEWKQFISIQNITEKLQGISGIGFIKHLKADEVDAFTENYFLETSRTFGVYPETEYDDKFVIKYVEPIAPNEKAVGLDIGFEKNRRAAAERSIKTGLPALTDKIELVQDNQERAGFLLLMPFFKDKSGDVERSQKEIYGWVYAPFIGENFLKNLVDLSHHEITFAVYDGEFEDDKYLIYKDALFDETHMDKQLSQTISLNIAGQEWLVVFKTTPLFSNNVGSYLPLLQITIGLLITGLLSWITYNQYTREQTVKKLVTVKTHELQELSANLEQTVLERTSALEKASHAKDTFLANMSHELRTPLNSIMGLVSMLLNERDMPKEHLQTLGTVEKASVSLLSIVNDVLDISKIEAEVITLEERPFELNGFVGSVVEQLKPLASQKGLVLKSNIDQLPQTIVASDTLRLSRIIMNLGGNATKYTLSGSVHVDVSLKDHEDDRFVLLQCGIKDTGIGIASDKLDHIFEKFTQAEETTERKFGGTGLGLSITKQLVELMGGDIHVTSQLGEGSVFTANIPLKRSTQDAIDAYAHEHQGALKIIRQNVDRIAVKDARVLIAEDHEFNQIFILKLLKQFGFQHLELVTNGVDAVEAYQKSEYDLVLMDCHMPKLNGYDATQEIRVFEFDQRDGKRTPVFAMTADAMAGTHEKCLEAGMDEYITKPIHRDVFKANLEVYFILDHDEAASLDEDNVSEDNELLFDLNILLSYTDNNLDDVKELLAIFYETSTNDIKILSDHRIDGPSDEWTEAAHRLKGGASYIGAEDLNGLCGDAQEMCDVTKDEREEQYANIKDCYDRVCERLKDERLL